MSDESIQQMKYSMMRHKFMSYHWIFLTFIFDTRKFLLSDVSSVFLRLQRICAQAVDIYTATYFTICTSLRWILCSKRLDRALARAVIRRPVTSMTWVQSQAIQWGIYDGHSSSVTSFSPSTSDSSCQCNSINTPYSLIHLSPTIENLRKTTSLSSYGSVPL